MVNDTQVLCYRRRRVSGQSQEVAAAAAGMTAKTARKWEKGLLASHLHKKPRHWRTRKDPFKDVFDWDSLALQKFFHPIDLVVIALSMITC